MTNTQTILGAFAWSTVAATLMLITFAPVPVAQHAGSAAVSAAAATSPAF